MRTRRIQFLVIVGFVLAASVVVWASPKSKPAVAITVLGYKTNVVSGFAYVSASIGVTNNSKRILSYYARGSASFVDYGIWSETSEGWKAPSTASCGFGITKQTLSPGQG